MGIALGCAVSARVNPTRVPLVHQVVFDFGEELSGWAMMRVWNLFQMFAAYNDCSPQGRLDSGARKMIVEVAVKRRLGEPRDDHPALQKNTNHAA